MYTHIHTHTHTNTPHVCMPIYVLIRNVLSLCNIKYINIRPVEICMLCVFYLTRACFFFRYASKIYRSSKEAKGR